MGMHQMLGPSFGASDDYVINRSLRFNSADSAYLNRTPSSAGNRKTWTLSFWVKLCGTSGHLVSAGNDAFQFEIRSDGQYLIQNSGCFSNTYSTAVFRDYSAWQHFVIEHDATNTYCKIYVNGSLQKTITASNADGAFNNNTAHNFNGRSTSLDSFTNFYLAEVHFIDGQALAASDFGEYNDDNVWQPKKYTGTYGSNGFFLKFADNSSNSALGTDSSGNSNTWTVNNLTAKEEKWSNYMTTTGTFLSNNGPDKAFDNSLSGANVPALDAGQPLTWSPPGGLAYSSKVEIYVGAVSGFTYSFNGATAVTATINAWNVLDTGSGTINSIVFDRGVNETHGPHAIRVDNVVLVDGNPANTDSLIDTPTNYEADSGNNGGNYCTLNPLKNQTQTLKNGNLISNGTSGRSTGTLYASSGKFYWEFTAGSSYTMAGIESRTSPYSASFSGENSQQYALYGNNGSGQLYHNSSITSFDGFVSGDVIGVALDMDAGNLYFYKNGSAMNSGSAAATGLTGAWTANCRSGSGAYNGDTVFNFGQRPFAYTPPSGYKSFCTTNLADPTIADGSTAFDTKLWTGDGSSSRAITGYDFSPDFVWIKIRNDSYGHAIFDAVRGANIRLDSVGTNADQTITDGLHSFDSNGFTIGNRNTVGENNKTYVGWAWDAGADSSKTYTVKVVSDSGNKYRFDDFGSSAVTLELEEGSTYVFDQSDNSNAGHPLRFSTTSNGTHGGGTEYTTGVTTTGTPGQAGAKTTIVVAASAPTLFYYCSVHSGMGGQANTNSTAGASNFDGSIQAVVRANPSAGFSIVSWTGNGTSGSTLGHGLNAAPKMVIFKNRGASSNWRVYNTMLDGSLDWLYLNTTAAKNDSSLSLPTNTVFTAGASTDTNGNGNAMINYCFAPVEGYSEFGSYTGNGSSDGTFVHTGFRPKWIIFKNASSSGDEWMMYDSERKQFNAVDLTLEANTADSENTSGFDIDFLSNGFKARTNNVRVNGSSTNYIYAAFAEHPFKTSRAR